MTNRYRLLAVGMIVPVLSVAAHAEFKLTPSDRVVLLGDVAVSEVQTLELFIQFMRTRYPDRTPLVCNLGEPRGTAKDGLRRLEREVFPLEPTEVVLCFGLDGPQRQRFDVGQLTAHMNDLRAMIDLIRARKSRVTLLTPPPPDESQHRGLQRIEFRESVGKYADAIRALGKELDIPVIDWHAGVTDRLQNFTGKGKPGWTKHGITPSWYSLAILTDQLLSHWGAEPLEYVITADWNADNARASIGGASVVSRSADELVVALTDVPVVVNMLGGQGMDPANWPLKKWFSYQLRIENIPKGAFVISGDGYPGKPFLDQQLRLGADMSTVGPLAENLVTRTLHDAILRECNQFTQYRIAVEREAPEPELEEGFRLLRDAELSLALGAQQITSRTPSRFSMTLRIQSALAAAKDEAQKPKATPGGSQPVKQPSGSPQPAAPKQGGARVGKHNG